MFSAASTEFIGELVVFGTDGPWLGLLRPDRPGARGRPPVRRAARLARLLATRTGRRGFRLRPVRPQRNSGGALELLVTASWEDGSLLSGAPFVLNIGLSGRASAVTSASSFTFGLLGGGYDFGPSTLFAAGPSSRLTLTSSPSCAVPHGGEPRGAAPGLLPALPVARLRPRLFGPRRGGGAACGMGGRGCGSGAGQMSMHLYGDIDMPVVKAAVRSWDELLRRAVGCRTAAVAAGDGMRAAVAGDMAAAGSWVPTVDPRATAPTMAMPTADEERTRWYTD